MTTLSTSYLTTTNEHRIDISQNRLYISSNLSKINDLSNNRIVSIGWSKGFEFARVGFEFARGLREKVRGEYVFSSFMKQKKKGKNYAVFCFAGKRKLFFLYL